MKKNSFLSKHWALPAVLCLTFLTTGYIHAETDVIATGRSMVSKDPLNSDANYNLGQTLMTSIRDSLRKESGLSENEKKVAQEAEKYLKDAISLSHNSNGKALAMLGLLYRLQHRYTEGISYLQEAIKLPPQTEEYLLAVNVLAESYAGMGNKTEALAVVNKGLEFHPSSADLQTKKRILIGQRETAASSTSQEDDRQKRAEQLSEELKKKIEVLILESKDSSEVMAQKLKKLQEEYQKKVDALSQ